MIKKIVVLASMALALIAMAAPAAQAGTEWTNTGIFTATGNLTSDRGILETGPAPVSLEVELTNEEGHGGGRVLGGEVEGVVPTNFPDCHAVATVHNFPWSITLTTPDTIDIGSHVVDPGEPPVVTNRTVTFINHYTTTPTETASCLGGAIPATVPATGTVTGTVENQGGEEVCINLETYTDDIYIEGTNYTGEPVNLTGVACIEGTEA